VVVTPAAKQPATPAVITPIAKQPVTPTVVTPAAKQPATPAVVTPTAKQPIAIPAVVTSTAQQPATPTVATPTVRSAITASTSQTPVIDVVNLVLKLNEKKVYVYKGDKLITKYPVAIGKKGWETPTGEWQVMEKVTNPGWTSFKDGKVIKPGSQSPLGQRWIGFWTDGKDMIGFHGTPDVKSIGTAASHGCVRMLNKDVKALFPLVKVGTTVKVVEE
jgi:lipoprotein-anchoring transpeptidase ErfK/SrfK